MLKNFIETQQRIIIEIIQQILTVQSTFLNSSELLNNFNSFDSTKLNDLNNNDILK